MTIPSNFLTAEGQRQLQVSSDEKGNSSPFGGVSVRPINTIPLRTCDRRILFNANLGLAAALWTLSLSNCILTRHSALLHRY